MFALAVSPVSGPLTECLPATHRKVASIMSDALRRDIAAHGEASGTVGVLALQDAVAPCDWHVIYHPLLHVVLVDTVVQEPKSALVLLLGTGIVLPAQEFAVILCLSKLDLMGGQAGKEGGVNWRSKYQNRSLPRMQMP